MSSNCQTSNILLLQICDKYQLSNVVSIAGNIFSIASFILIGPVVPSIRNSIMSSYFVAAMLGLAQGMTSVSAFTRAYNQALSKGYKDDENTNIIISGKFLFLMVSSKKII